MEIGGVGIGHNAVRHMVVVNGETGYTNENVIHLHRNMVEDIAVVKGGSTTVAGGQAVVS